MGDLQDKYTGLVATAALSRSMDHKAAPDLGLGLVSTPGPQEGCICFIAPSTPTTQNNDLYNTYISGGGGQLNGLFEQNQSREAC